MNGEKKRKLAVGSGMLAAMVGMAIFNNTQVAKANDDQWCLHDSETGVCGDAPNNPCSASKGWSCRHVKDLGDDPNNCGCTENVPQ